MMIGKIKNHIDNRKDENSHKGDFGRLLLVCGSKGMSGAAILSAKASVRAGAGLVTLATANSNYSAVAGSIYEVMQLPMIENRMQNRYSKPPIRAMHCCTAAE